MSLYSTQPRIVLPTSPETPEERLIALQFPLWRRLAFLLRLFVHGFSSK